MRFYFVVISCIISYSLHAQSADFLEITPDAHIAGLGNEGVALEANAFSLYRNMASLPFSSFKTSVAYSYTPWMKELIDHSNLHTAAVLYSFNQKHGVGVGFRYFTHPSYVMTDAMGEIKGEYEPKEFSIDLGYAYKISTHIALAANIHYVSSDMGNQKGVKKGKAFTADLEGFYHTNNWNLGVAITNIGTKIDYGYSKYNLPASIKAGGMYRWIIHTKHQLSGNAGIKYHIFPSDYSGISAGLGVEYKYNQFLALRTGYHIADEEKTGYNFFTLGTGITWKGLGIDFSYWVTSSDCPLKNTYQVSGSWKF